MGNAPIAEADIATWLEGEGVEVEAAQAAAGELAKYFNDGDRTYQMVRDVLGGNLSDDDPHPKDLADDLGTHFKLRLTD
jgi:hypothetical protein